MTDRTIDLDQHRGMAAQKATDQRRMLAEVEANELTLRLRRDELETQLLAEPAANWPVIFSICLLARLPRETTADRSS